jgi:hypothetical protein
MEMVLGCERGWCGGFGIRRLLVCGCTLVKLRLWMGTVVAILAIPVLDAALKLCAAGQVLPPVA